MLLFDGGLGLVLMGVWVFALIDVIQSDGSAVRNLPKSTWALLVLFTFEIGAIAWFVAGRPVGAANGPASHAVGHADDDDAFLRGVRRAEEQRRREAARSQAERDRLRGDPGDVQDRPPDDFPR